jgi:hypothetical protein
MKQWLFYSLLISLCLSCKKDLPNSEVFGALTFSGEQFVADGSTTVLITVTLHKYASLERRNVVFKTNSGIFTINGLQTTTSKAEFEAGMLTAKATLRVSVIPAIVTVSAKPEFISQAQDFKIERTFVTTPSMPVSLKLETSNFGLKGNYSSEAFLSGTLMNEAGNFVSKGFKVSFEDELAGGVPAGGRYRKLQDQTTDSSRVSSFYSSTAYPIGTDIKIRCTLLNSQGLKTKVLDSIILTINK